MSKLEIKIDKTDTVFKIYLLGVVDEEVDFGSYSLSGASSVEMHLDKIKGINSCGIREWIRWIGTAGTADIKYSGCPKIIVDQINMVRGFLPDHAKVLSFYVPYYSNDSGAEKSVLYISGQHYTAEGELIPPAVKDDDGNLMEMDIVESKYFKFLKRCIP